MTEDEKKQMYKLMVKYRKTKPKKPLTKEQKAKRAKYMREYRAKKLSTKTKLTK